VPVVAERPGRATWLGPVAPAALRARVRTEPQRNPVRRRMRTRSRTSAVRWLTIGQGYAQVGGKIMWSNSGYGTGAKVVENWGVATLRPGMQQACADSKVPCHFLDPSRCGSATRILVSRRSPIIRGRRSRYRRLDLENHAGQLHRPGAMTLYSGQARRVVALLLRPWAIGNPNAITRRGPCGLGSKRWSVARGADSTLRDRLRAQDVLSFTPA